MNRALFHIYKMDNVCDIAELATMTMGISAKCVILIVLNVKATLNHNVQNANKVLF